MPSISVEPEKVLKDLRDLWAQLAADQKAEAQKPQAQPAENQPGQQESEALKSPEQHGGLLRACSMTLIIAAENCEDGVAVRRTTGVLMHSHPNRAIILCPSENADLTARVFSECWMPLGRAQQICSEGIEITGDPVLYNDAARLLVPLLVSDLPVVLWCRGPRAFLDRTLDPLFELADKIVFDTDSARHAPWAVGFLKRLRQEGHKVADLAWTRLTPWREVVSHVFDDRVPAWQTIVSARLIYGGDAPDSRSLYLGRWIEKAAPGISVDFISKTAAAPGLAGLEISLQGYEVSVRATQESCLEVRAGDRVSRSALPPSDTETLMREELGILDGDPVFDRVLE